MTLVERIETWINVGEKDPHEIARKIRSASPDAWIATELLALADELIAQIARQKLGNQRRTSIARIDAGSLGDQEIMLRSMWVPRSEGIVYKRLADMTAEDFDARADHMEKLAGRILEHAQWCRDMATAIRASGCATAAGLDVLPALRGAA